MRLWVTRSQPGAARTAERLRALGHDTLIAPVLRIEPLPVECFDLEQAGALAFTSAAGVAAFAALAGGESALRRAPVFAVGEATAEAARVAGAIDVRSADGDGAALARLIVSSRADFEGPVLAPGPRAPAFDLPGALVLTGVLARALPVYASVAASEPPESAATALASGRLDGVIVQSPAAGRALAAYAADDAAFAAAFARLAAYALSPACAAPLADLLARPAATPAAPRERELLALPPRA